MTIYRTTAGVTALAVALALAACGDDDDGASGTADADLADYCDASLAIETFRFPDIDLAGGPAEIRAALADVAVDYRPLLGAALDTVPDDLHDDGAAYIQAFEDVVETGDLSLLDAPRVRAAEERLHAFDLEHCGWNAVEVTAEDYAFTGLPRTLPAGLTSFELTNEGDEVHHLVVARVDDDVELSTEELLELDQEEAAAYVTFPIEDPLAVPGDVDHSVGDLEPGRYIVACFVPLGTTSLDASPEGPPHFTQGMVAELTVE